MVVKVEALQVEKKNGKNLTPILVGQSTLEIIITKPVPFEDFWYVD